MEGSSGKRTYEFFDEEDDDSQQGRKLDLIYIQKRILTSLLNLRGSAEEDEDETTAEVSVGDG